MEMKVNLQERSYPIYIEKGSLNHLNDYFTKYQNKKIAIITDDHVNFYYGKKVREQLVNKDFIIIEVPHGETSKNFSILPSLYQQLLNFKLTRSDLIIALGGGVIGDLAGFVAATYLRGVDLIQIPTSLLAQVDSSVGGKVAVDLESGKNLVGAFYHPKMVIIDPEVLKTLEPHFISDGMGEVIKYGCIQDEQLFDKLASYKSFKELYQEIDDIIYRCVDIKRQCVEQDERDFGARLLLNFGHTLAHTIEQHFHYQTYSHGQAVAIGMYQITKLSESKQMTKTGTALKIKQLLHNYQLEDHCDVLMDDLVDTIKLDKKNIDHNLSLVLLEQIGKAKIYPTDIHYFDQLERV